MISLHPECVVWRLTCCLCWGTCQQRTKTWLDHWRKWRGGWLLVLYWLASWTSFIFLWRHLSEVETEGEGFSQPDYCLILLPWKTLSFLSYKPALSPHINIMCTRKVSDWSGIWKCWESRITSRSWNLLTFFQWPDLNIVIFSLQPLLSARTKGRDLEQKTEKYQQDRAQLSRLETQKEEAMWGLAFKRVVGSETVHWQSNV